MGGMVEGTLDLTSDFGGKSFCAAAEFAPLYGDTAFISDDSSFGGSDV
jgi:hypothetical protein